MVKLPEDSNQAVWTHHTLRGSTAFERCRDVTQVMPSSSFYDDVYLAAIEVPKTRFMPSAAAMFPVFGAVVALLPQSLVLWDLHPKTWRSGIGLKGNASKDEIAERVLQLWERLPLARADAGLETQDTFDAFAIAFYARENNSWAPTRQLASTS